MQGKGEQHLNEEHDVKDESDRVDFGPDNDMISKTESDRLEAWKVLHTKNLEERVITEKKEFTTLKPQPSSTNQNSFTSNTGVKHRPLSPKEIFTSSAKRLSFPLPGWMEELHLKNQYRSYSSMAYQPRLVVYAKVSNIVYLYLANPAFTS